MWNKYKVEAWLAGATQAPRMEIVNSGNFLLQVLQPENLQYLSPDCLDDFLQAMNPLNKIYYFTMHSTAPVS